MPCSTATSTDSARGASRVPSPQRADAAVLWTLACHPPSSRSFARSFIIRSILPCCLAAPSLLHSAGERACSCAGRSLVPHVRVAIALTRVGRELAAREPLSLRGRSWRSACATEHALVPDGTSQTQCVMLVAPRCVRQAGAAGRTRGERACRLVCVAYRTGRAAVLFTS